eukprot:TRINITY_DN4276_c0_g1_i3.p1 TRINITY_DN4276_c0_g1~~TRINITY_DN4276_c0_g1_i3.p1  ORF type:complete len:308 (-),score=32.29 TRINITY_DN4276_c0_g1_i3:328-1251(-)
MMNYPRYQRVSSITTMDDDTSVESFLINSRIIPDVHNNTFISQNNTTLLDIIDPLSGDSYSRIRELKHVGQRLADELESTLLDKAKENNEKVLTEKELSLALLEKAKLQDENRLLHFECSHYQDSAIKTMKENDTEITAETLYDLFIKKSGADSVRSQKKLPSLPSSESIVAGQFMDETKASGESSVIEEHPSVLQMLTDGLDKYNKLLDSFKKIKNQLVISKTEHDALAEEVARYEKERAVVKECMTCHTQFALSQNMETSCVHHHGRLKFYSCRGCGADEYFSCCNRCMACSKGCKTAKHIPRMD